MLLNGSLETTLIAGITVKGLHMHWDTCLIFCNQIQDYLIQIRAMISALALGQM